MQNLLNKLVINFDRKSNVKSGKNWSNCFREEDVGRLRDVIHVYSPGARADNPGGHILIVNERVCYFDNTL